MSLAAPRLLLASSSLRRRALLRQLGITFTWRTPRINETPRPKEKPQKYVLRLAVAKAHAVQNMISAEKMKRPRHYDAILGADTVVALDNKILGKPRDRAHAKMMLQQLSGRAHKVYTAIALLHNQTCTTRIACTHVRLAKIDDQLIARYLASGEGDDKAGGYAIQGRAAAFVAHLAGSYSNVVGLPLYELTDALRALDLLDD